MKMKGRSRKAKIESKASAGPNVPRTFFITDQNQCPVRVVGLNRSTQHFILEGKMECSDGSGISSRVHWRLRKRSYGIAGSAGSRSRRSGERLVSRHRPFIFRWHRTGVSVLRRGAARDCIDASEREEISRGITAHQSARSIARLLAARLRR